MYLRSPDALATLDNFRRENADDLELYSYLNQTVTARPHYAAPYGIPGWKQAGPDSPTGTGTSIFPESKVKLKK
jgi:hypothetical protein